LAEPPRSFIEVAQSFVEVPRRFVEVPQRFVEVARSFVEVPRRFVEVAQSFVEALRRFVEVPRRSVEPSHAFKRSARTSVGVDQDFVHRAGASAAGAAALRYTASVRISGGFAAALFGIAMTLLSWYGPWAWPAWPALTTLHLLFGSGFDELPYNGRAAVVVMLIVINVGFWGGVAYGAGWIYSRYRRRLRTPASKPNDT